MNRKNGIRAAMFMVLAPLVLTACVRVEHEGMVPHYTGWGMKFVDKALFIGKFINGVTDDELRLMPLDNTEGGCTFEKYGEYAGFKDSGFLGYRCTGSVLGIPIR